jgi:CBS domain containing-hemolysin-like protein
METGVNAESLLAVEMLARIALQLALLMASAFFSGSEVALFSLSRLDLDKLRRTRHPKSTALYDLLEQPRRLIISILCGNELINVAAAANMAAILVVLVGVDHAGWLNLLVMVPMLLLFGEVTPKTIAISNPVKISTAIVATPMTAWVKLVSPLRWAIRQLADQLTTRLVGSETEPENILQVDEVRTLAQALEQSGELRIEERILVDTLLEAATTEVIEIMVPRTRVLFISVETPVAAALAQIRAARHSRVPVYRNHRDNLAGFLHAEDFLPLSLDGADAEAQRLVDLLRPVVVVPPTKRVDEMLEFFRAQGVEAAAVVNEFGGVEGFVTIKTVLDFIFNPVSGGSPRPEQFQGSLPDSYEVPGEMKLDQFEDLTNFAVSDPRMTTIGGLVYRHLDRLPVAGDSVVVEGIRFEVLAMEGHRIARLRAQRGAEKGAN